MGFAERAAAFSAPDFPAASSFAIDGCSSISAASMITGGVCSRFGVRGGDEAVLGLCGIGGGLVGGFLVAGGAGIVASTRSLDCAGGGVTTSPSCRRGTWLLLVSTIASSSALRAVEPGGGGGIVRGRLRPVLAAFGGAGGSGGWSSSTVSEVSGSPGAAADGVGGASSDQPEARSSMRDLVASPRRRRVRSSSGTTSQ